MANATGFFFLFFFPHWISLFWIVKKHMGYFNKINNKTGLSLSECKDTFQLICFELTYMTRMYWLNVLDGHSFKKQDHTVNLFMT